MPDAAASDLLTGFSQPVAYTSDAVDLVPVGAGVHVVWGPTADDGILYVGQTRRLRDRMRQHLTGDRQASVLFEQVAELLDGDYPDSAGRDEVRAWLATCRFAWKEHNDPAQLKRQLLEVLEPRFNRQNPSRRSTEAGRTVVSTGLEGPMADGWDRFVHWAKRLAEANDLDADEREPKFVIAGLLDQARTALASDEPWIEPLKLAIRYQDNNLLVWRLKSPFLTWVEQNSEVAGAALASVWDASIEGDEAVERFVAALPTKVVSGIGTRAGIASLLRMAVDVETNPVIRPATFQAAYALTGFDSTSPATERTTWADGVRFCDTFIAEAALRGFAIKDRLDAQSLIWMIINNGPAAAWAPDEQAAFTAYRSGRGDSARGRPSH